MSSNKFAVLKKIKGTKFFRVKKENYTIQRPSMTIIINLHQII